MGFSLQNLFTSSEPALQLAFRTRWRSARERAAHCAVLAQRTGMSLDYAMLGGLLQDIGSLPLLSELEHWPNVPRESETLQELCERLLCRAEVLKAGQRQAVCRADVFALKDGQEKLVATGLATIARV